MMNVNKFIGITYDVIDALGLFVVSNKNEQRNSKNFEKHQRYLSSNAITETITLLRQGSAFSHEMIFRQLQVLESLCNEFQSLPFYSCKEPEIIQRISQEEILVPIIANHIFINQVTTNDMSIYHHVDKFLLFIRGNDNKYERNAVISFAHDYLLSYFNQLGVNHKPTIDTIKSMIYELRLHDNSEKPSQFRRATTIKLKFRIVDEQLNLDLLRLEKNIKALDNAQQTELNKKKVKVLTEQLTCCRKAKSICPKIISAFYATCLVTYFDIKTSLVTALITAYFDVKNSHNVNDILRSLSEEYLANGRSLINSPRILGDTLGSLYRNALSRLDCFIIPLKLMDDIQYLLYHALDPESPLHYDDRFYNYISQVVSTHPHGDFFKHHEHLTKIIEKIRSNECLVALNLLDDIPQSPLQLQGSLKYLFATFKIGLIFRLRESLKRTLPHYSLNPPVNDILNHKGILFNYGLDGLNTCVFHRYISTQHSALSYKDEGFVYYSTVINSIYAYNKFVPKIGCVSDGENKYPQGIYGLLYDFDKIAGDIILALDLIDSVNSLKDLLDILKRRRALKAIDFKRNIIPNINKTHLLYCLGNIDNLLKCLCGPNEKLINLHQLRNHEKLISAFSEFNEDLRFIGF